MSLTLPTDERIKNKIKLLVEDGVYSTSEVRRHIFHFVRHELFAGCEMPLSSNRRFFPSPQDIRNVIYRARVARLHSKIDQENLVAKIAEWQTHLQHSDDKFHFRPYCETQPGDIADSDDMAVDDDVQMTRTHNQQGVGLLFCHQTRWQQGLLLKYGCQICLLDATYKTSKYAMPLFFVCVKTNVDYVVVATFITQSEDTVSLTEALALLKQWNPQWSPLNWMVDFSEVEINALQSVFPGMHICIIFENVLYACAMCTLA